jgi:HEAT repeat protein
MKRLVRLLLAVIAGLGTLIAGVWLLTVSLGDHEMRYQGKTLAYWSEQSTNQDPAAVSRAKNMVSNVVIPQLTNQMFADTTDSKLRLSLIDLLNGLPGIQINFTPADGRRVQAIKDLGSLGPQGQQAIPALLEALRQNDDILCGTAAEALVKIQADPQTVVPALIGCMTDGNGNGRPDVVEALGQFGPKAKDAVPALIKLLQDRSSKDIMTAVPAALKKIDPAAAASAGVK